MAEVKPFRDYNEQIKKLKSSGLVVADEEFCKRALINIGYYRLSAYFLPFKATDGSFVPGTDFSTVYDIYEFDRKLRSILFSAIEVIEVHLRSMLSYYHSSKYGPLGYLDPNCFNNKHNSEKFGSTIAREIDNNKNIPFVRHHLEKYNGRFPLWVISELFTFGTLSYFYNDLKTSDKKELFGVYYKEAVSWLRCCTDLRNICAHYGRLYYRIFPAMPSGFDISEESKRRLWGAVLCVKTLYPSSEKWNREFMPAIEALFEQYRDAIDLYRLAFPDNWADQLRK